MMFKLRRSQVGQALKVLVVFLVIWLVVGWRLVARKTHRILVPSAASNIASAIQSGGFALNELHQPEIAVGLCRVHGWGAFTKKEPESAPSRKVYDLVLINTELDWLEIRLKTSYEYVDYFVVVEGRKTFTGLEKPLLVKENWDRFAAYHAKIIYHELEYAADFDPKTAWHYEDMQRRATFTQVLPRLGGARAPRAGDVLVVADVDELVRPEALVVLRACAFPPRLTLRSQFYYYSFQWRHRGPQWAHPQATTYAGPRGTVLPDHLRVGDGANAVAYWLQKDDLWNAGWHCSSCFATVAEMLRKMESFSHTPLNAAEFRDRDRIADRVRRGADLWDREGEVYDRVDGNKDVPPPLLAEKDKWSYMLDRDGPTAGFVDYP